MSDYLQFQAECKEMTREELTRMAYDQRRGLWDLGSQWEQQRDALEGMVKQFGHWSEGDPPGLYSGGLSALEYAFDVLGWDEPHPCPEQTCDVKGCNKQVSAGWPSEAGYRRTCGDHYRKS